MRIKLVAIPSLLFLVFVGCTKSPSGFLEGEVVFVSSNLTSLEASPEFNGLVSYSNETVRFGKGFVFGVQTSDGIYIIQLDPTDKGGSRGPQTVYSLAAVIKVGTKVKFPTELHGRCNPNRSPMGFSKSKVGMLDPDDIELLIE